MRITVHIQVRMNLPSTIFTYSKEQKILFFQNSKEYKSLYMYLLLLLNFLLRKQDCQNDFPYTLNDMICI